MFHYSTILREIVQSLVKVTLLLKHSVKLLHYTECFNRSVTLARLCTSSLRMVEDRNM